MPKESGAPRHGDTALVDVDGTRPQAGEGGRSSFGRLASTLVPQHSARVRHHTGNFDGRNSRLAEHAGAAEASEASEARNVTDASDPRADFDDRFQVARQRLVAIAGSLVGAQEADDVVHDSYLLARSRYGQLRDPAALEPWLTQIVVNQCFSRHRRTKRFRDLLPALRPRHASSSDVGLRELVERLPARERTVLVLHYGHGYRLDEIAALLDLTHTNVRTIIARTRQRLFAAWREAEGIDR